MTHLCISIAGLFTTIKYIYGNTTLYGHFINHSNISFLTRMFILFYFSKTCFIMVPNNNCGHRIQEIGRYYKLHTYNHTQPYNGWSTVMVSLYQPLGNVFLIVVI